MSSIVSDEPGCVEGLFLGWLIRHTPTGLNSKTIDHDFNDPQRCLNFMREHGGKKEIFGRFCTICGEYELEKGWLFSDKPNTSAWKDIQSGMWHIRLVSEPIHTCDGSD